MIISPYYRFVFVAVPKTGTTSIEEALYTYLSSRGPTPMYAKVTANRGYQFLYRNLRDYSLALPPPFMSAGILQARVNTFTE